MIQDKDAGTGSKGKKKKLLRSALDDVGKQ